MGTLDYNAFLEEFRSVEKTPEAKAAFAEKVKQMVSGQSLEEKQEALKTIANRVNEIKAALDLSDVTSMASVEYIAKTYFQKSRSWLSQRLNANKINGETVELTNEEKKILATALSDLSLEFQKKSLSILQMVN